MESFHLNPKGGGISSAPRAAVVSATARRRVAQKARQRRVETVVLGNTSELGDFLTTPTGRTLYMFTNDEAGVSNCTGECLNAWAPLTVMANDRLAASSTLKGKWSTITREDKSMQVTYNGMPLYTFKNDKKPGDATGVSDVWPLAKP